MDDIVCRTNGAGETIAFRRHHGIAGTNHREVCVPGGFGEMRVNRFDREGAGDLAGVAASYAVTHDIESERGVTGGSITPCNRKASITMSCQILGSYRIAKDGSNPA